jgi:hypothetical protein
MDQQLSDLILATRDQAQAERERISLEQERIRLEQKRFEMEREKIIKLDRIYDKLLQIENAIQVGLDPELRKTAYWVSLLLEIQRIIASKLLVDDHGSENARLYELMRDLRNQDINLNFSKEVSTVIGQSK